MTIDTETDYLGWFCNTTFSTFVEPVSRLTEYVFRLQTPTTPGLFDNCTTVFNEKVYRGAVGAGIVGAGALVLKFASWTLLGYGVLGYGGLLLGTRLGAYYLQNGKGYTYVKGQAEEKSLPANNQFSVMNWNVCGIWGGISRSNGGVLEWQKRFDGILREIQNADADVLILEEIYDTALAEKLVDSLKGKYAHFYTVNGPSVWGSVGGLFMATKFPVRQYTHTSFDNNDWTLNRGFGTLEIGSKEKPFATVIGTHLIHGKADAKRTEQIAQLTNSVAQKTFPAFVAGDLNLSPEKLAQAAVHPATEQNTGMTCTDKFIREGWNPKNTCPDERLDYIAQVKNEAPKVRVVVKQLGLLNGKNTQTALSDHDAMVAQITVA